MSLSATPSKSFSSYGSDGFVDDPTEGEFYDEYEEADAYADGEDDDWAWEDYDETCEYEDYDPGEYDENNDIDQDQDGQEEAYDESNEFGNDVVILDKDDDVEESYTTHNGEDVENQEVVHVINSDGERYEDDYKAYKYEDSHDENYYCDNYVDDDTIVDHQHDEEVDPRGESNYNCGEDYDAGDDDEYQEGCHDCDKSLDVAKEHYQEDLDHFYGDKEEFQDRQTPEDDCFVVEVIE